MVGCYGGLSSGKAATFLSNLMLRWMFLELYLSRAASRPSPLQRRIGKQLAFKVDTNVCVLCLLSGI